MYLPSLAGTPDTTLSRGAILVTPQAGASGSASRKSPPRRESAVGVLIVVVVASVVEGRSVGWNGSGQHTWVWKDIEN